MKRTGLTTEQVEESRNKHGSNSLTQIPAEPLWKKILEGFKDPMIMILLVALVVQVVLFFLGQAEWFEPAGILIAIMIANGVASVSESKQEGKASALKAEEEAKETAKVIRDGKLEEIHVSEIVVVVCEIYRKNGEWKFNAVAAGYQGGLEALCRNYGVNV